MANRFQQMKSKKNSFFGPKSKKLVDLISDTMYDKMHEAIEEDSVLLDDDILKSYEDYFDSSENNADEESPKQLPLLDVTQ